ncbi:hypothetical protein [Pseudoponticoccus marisrubri]|uniref:Aconitase A/isopropylmalate dehydratase small subunit swivel domain-containing protein n=1 Tax=Pseudoponticoccus marisrubri TaxID=1685382 RepID=A0A0W7WEG1_9RHOB|nr:hypothetical protein [Pseudoponticoccus marisrubri]KUF08965.1 hypothetical protein AVJ23_19955 [Pseudoponticoccus marisrubri]
MSDETLARGKVRVFGDDINTDYIVPSHRKKRTIDPDLLRHHIFEDICAGFYEELEGPTILVAGRNFGCGSAMEIAVTVLQRAGIEAVVATSFARTFKRNAINNGLLLCEVDAGEVPEDTPARVCLRDGALALELGERLLSPAQLPAFMLDILRSGGLVPYLRRNGGFQI